MKDEILKLTRRYQDALQTHLKQGHRAGLESARGLGSQALAAGLRTMDLARLNEQTLIASLSTGCSSAKRAALVKQAGIFFAMAITPIEKTNRSDRDATAHLENIVQALSHRTVELAASNMELSLEIAQRKAAEAALKQSERHSIELLAQSQRQREQLRQLSRQMLSAQEEERRRISRELHDVIAQTLTGINLRLAALKKEASLNAKGFDLKIAQTQRMVEKSVDIVHEFARELRPAVLDDLGLIPALHSFMKSFTEQTGVRTHLSAFAGVEELNTDGRTVFFRVAQEALANVAKHAQASRVQVSIEKLPDSICMKIKDDGKSFDAARALLPRASKRLGLLGMRERLEMAGGHFDIESAPGKGTTVIAHIPFGKALPGKSAKASEGTRS
jgi:signal transduction histidine kinase